MSTEFQSKFDVVKTVNVKITVSDYEVGANVNLNHPPDKIMNNDNFDGSRRWAVFGPLHWINFQFDQDITLYGMDIAWYEGSSHKVTFEILSNDKILWKGASTGSFGNYETYKFKDELTTKNIRVLCRGNTVDQWNMITSVRFRPEPIQEDGVQQFPQCPEGQHWHDMLQRCVGDVITKPPAIVITEPIQTVRHGDRVSINADKTTDPNGANMFYEWTQMGGETVNTSNKLEPNLIFKVPTVDTEMVFRLKVTNSANLSSTADAKVAVRAAIPQCPPGEIWSESLKRCVGLSQPEPAVKPKTKPKKRQGSYAGTHFLNKQD